MRKRPVSLRQLEEVTQSVERELRNLGISEVKSDMIGEIVMEELRDIDDVAYVRFASVYRQFKDLNVFIEELKDILQKKESKICIVFSLHTVSNEIRELEAKANSSFR